MGIVIYTVGDFVKKFRVKNGLTQLGLSDKLGYSAQYVSNVERGAHPRPVIFCAKLAQYLEGDEVRILDDLLSESIDEKMSLKFKEFRPKRKKNIKTKRT